VYSRIVVGYDGRDGGRDALALAVMLARLAKSSLLLVYVATEQPKWYRTDRDYRRALRDEIGATLGPALEHVPPGIDARKASIESPSPARGLHELASEDRATLLVLGSTHRGPIGRVLVGSVGELLLMGAPCAVTVAPKGYAKQTDDGIDRVAVGFSGSAESRGALSSAAVLAQAWGARLAVIGIAETRGHVRHRRESDDTEGGLTGDLEQEIEEAVKGLPANIEVERSIIEGDPIKSLSSASADTDLMIIGSRGYGPMHHVLLGSVSAKLMRSVASPILVVPRGARAPVEGVSPGESSTG
jgi:nucleotide-binding universal stress UspA family protein